MYEHLIFFDGECPFCHRSVRHILSVDAQKCFVFAPLSGKTANEILIGPHAPLRKANSLVLVENYESTGRRFWMESRAILRIYWLIKGWGIVGIFSFLPGFFGDWIYRWVAAHRHQYKLRMPDSPGPKERFLP